MYTPKTIKNKSGTHRHPAAIWKEQVAAAWLESRPSDFETLTGPLKLTTLFFISRPKSHFRSNGLLKASAPDYCPSKPDFDNLAKAVADQLTMSGVWSDDDQVCIALQVKRYAGMGEQSGCEVHVSKLYDFYAAETIIKNCTQLRLSTDLFT